MSLKQSSQCLRVIGYWHDQAENSDILPRKLPGGGAPRTAALVPWHCLQTLVVLKLLGSDALKCWVQSFILFQVLNHSFPKQRADLYVFLSQ